MGLTPSVLICDDDELYHMAVKMSLKGQYDCRSAYDSDEALVILKKHSIDIVLLDIEMRNKNEGFEAIPKLRVLDPDLQIVICSGRSDFETAREALRLGATDYVVKDSSPNELKHVLERVFSKKKLLLSREQQSTELKANERNNHTMIGSSKAMQLIRKTLEKYRPSPMNVLISGETGTGKEVIARSIRSSNKEDGSLVPFIAVDSSTIQSSTAESLLFGHEKGAFTGAEKTSKGIFEEANGGIVYFDEIANMPLEIQAKLLRVLQEKEVTRLGSTRPIPLEFRVVCATNKDLEAMCKNGQFKDDLLQRINVLPIHVPPLRERKDDIPELVKHFVSRQGDRLSCKVFTPEALNALMQYDWPGNIRELANVVAYILTMSESDEIELSDLPPKIRDFKPAKGSARVQAAMTEGQNFYQSMSQHEKSLLSEAYEKHSGNVSQMALSMGMDRSHLYAKLKEHAIHQPRNKSSASE